MRTGLFPDRAPVNGFLMAHFPAMFPAISVSQETCCLGVVALIPRGRDKMATIFQTTFSNAFS